jgi:hypothetical protein
VNCTRTTGPGWRSTVSSTSDRSALNFGASSCASAS